MATTFERLSCAVRDKLSAWYPEVDWREGSVALGQFKAPPAIVLVHSGGRYEAPSCAGTVRGNRVAWKPIATDVMSVVAHIDAPSAEECERLRAAFITALRAVFGTSARVRRYIVTSEGHSGEAHGSYVRAALDMEWDVTVAERHPVTNDELGASAPTRPLAVILGTTTVIDITTP